MIKQKVTEFNSNFLVETRLTFTKKEIKAFSLDKTLERKVDAIINRYKRNNMKKRNYSGLFYKVDLKNLHILYPSSVLFHVYYNIAYLDRKYIILNKQKAFAEEIKAKIKASIDA